MLQQLAAQLQAAEQRPVTRDNLVPFMVLLSFLFTAWVVYSGVIDDVVAVLDLAPSAFAGVEELNPTVQLNGFTFDHELNPDLYYTQGYGYPD